MNVLKVLTTTNPFLKHQLVTHSQLRYIKYLLFPTLKELRQRKDQLGREPLQPRSSFLEWNYKSELYSFAKRLGEEFNEQLLRKALIENSYVEKLEIEQKNAGIEQPIELPDNSDMISAGEKIINDFILLYLRHILPRFPEEGIQSLKTYLMSEDILSHISFHLGISDLILCKEFPVNSVTLARVLKALIFALNESTDLERTSLFIRDFIITQLAEKNINDLWLIENPICVLNKICENECLDEPEPRIIGVAGVNTILALYRVGLYINKQFIGLGAGESVKIAHEMAATDTLRRLFKTSEHQLQIPWDTVLDPETNSIPNVSIENWCEKVVENRLEQISKS